MGDRTPCTLYLPIPPNQELTELLAEHFWEPDEVENDRIFTWEEVNYGTLPEEVKHHLTTEKIPYVWVWGAGDGYTHGVEISDGDRSEAFMTDDSGAIVIHLSQLNEDPGFIAAANRWQGIRKTIIRGIL